MNQQPWVKLVVIALVFFAVVISYSLEIPHFNRYLAFTTVLLVGSGIGFVVGLIVYLFIRTRLSQDGLVQTRALLTALFMGAFLSPLLLSLTNRWFSAPVEAKQVVFVEEEARYSSRFGLDERNKPIPNSYFVFFYYRDRLQRISFPQRQFAGVAEGDTVNLMIYPGAFGWEYVPFQ